MHFWGWCSDQSGCKITITVLWKTCIPNCIHRYWDKVLSTQKCRVITLDFFQQVWQRWQKQFIETHQIIITVTGQYVGVHTTSTTRFLLANTLLPSLSSAHTHTHTHTHMHAHHTRHMHSSTVLHVRIVPFKNQWNKICTADQLLIYFQLMLILSCKMLVNANPEYRHTVILLTPTVWTLQLLSPLWMQCGCCCFLGLICGNVLVRWVQWALQTQPASWESYSSAHDPLSHCECRKAVCWNNKLFHSLSRRRLINKCIKL